MNWGYKILVVYIVFVLAILFMVFKSSMQKTDLVTTDYYAKELKYQQKIDEIKRADALSAPVKYEIKDNELIIVFPKDFNKLMQRQSRFGTVLSLQGSKQFF